jgi:two-component system sensor histidine kinase KdpD
MTSPVLPPLLLRSERPSRPAGVLAALAAVAAATAVIYPLKEVTPVLSLGVLYVLAVLAVSVFWGLGFGIATSLLSAAAFNFFHLPPGGRFALADERDWVALLAFVVVAVATGMLAELARARSREAEQRRQEADLASEMAQLLLGTAELEGALEVAAQRLAEASGVSSASISLRELEADDRSLLFALRGAEGQIGTLLLDGALSNAERLRIAERVVPSLESILAAALHRAELQAEVVETVALRRSDELKTAVLRSVSHDLRTPLTAILMAAAALDPARPTSENVSDVREQVIDAATRLWRLIEKLLDLSVL